MHKRKVISLTDVSQKSLSPEQHQKLLKAEALVLLYPLYKENQKVFNRLLALEIQKDAI